MVQNNVFLLGKWLDLADDTYSTSKKLMYEMFTAKKSMNISMWLLHWSIELYLKAFLMSHNTKFGRTHDLICLFDQCVTIDSRLDNLCLQIPEVPNKQRYWINWKSVV